MQKAKELQPKKPKEKEQPWRETHNHHYEFDKDLKRLQGCALTNTEYVSSQILNKLQYRINILPRSYEKTIPQGKTEAFTMTSNFGKEFHKDYTGMLGMTGRTLIQRNMETFDVISR